MGAPEMDQVNGKSVFLLAGARCRSFSICEFIAHIYRVTKLGRIKGKAE